MSGEFEVILHCGTKLGTVAGANAKEFTEELTCLLRIGDVHILRHHQKVRVEPHDHLLVMNGDGNERRHFAKIGECVHNGLPKAVVAFTDRYKRKTLALVALHYVLPLKGAQEVARSGPH